MPKNNPFPRHFIDDGLSPEKATKRYKKRRQTFMKACRYLSVIIGAQRPVDSDHLWAMAREPLFQEPFILYLTGLNQLKTILILDPTSDTEKELLFVDKISDKYTFWEGDYLGVGNKETESSLRQLTGIKVIYPLSDFYTVLLSKLSTQKGKKKLGMPWHASSKKILKDHYYTYYKKISAYLKKQSKHPVTIHNIMPYQWEERLSLDTVDQQTLKQAAHFSGQLFKGLCKTISSFQTEHQLSGYIYSQLYKHSPLGASFPPIVASGANATTLHYTANHSPLKKTDLLLLDFGIRHHSMVSDVSRTIPLSGKFNPLQALLYTIVLSAQKKVEKAVKSGVTIQEINTLCWTYIESELKKQVLDQGGKITRAYTSAPHGVSHLIGLIVHDGDPSSRYKTQPLKPGMLISNEPGLYGTFELTINGKHYKETLGIRIEDMLWVTDSGCENLTRSIPKTISMLEKLLCS